ncbi:UDP-glucuronosyltransferase 2B14-like [Zootermopsis nevadensis]|uniref:UDP-glucuronosyltransferase 2B14-like n=1 Tax=Zootermopsis nevadensis TaxID=136037 RepID=UPI000B8E3437|nr:UDP-glucuronosyltransferase 2B14-like [Zootermopsis nevadensis]
MRCYAVFVLSVLVASVCIGDSKSARILGLFNFNGRSHFVMFEALLKGLAARGHQVHVVGHFPQKNPVPNYTDISVEGSIPAVFNNFTVPGAVEFGKYDNVLRFVFQTSVDMCEILMEHPKLQELLHSNETYDLIITELFAVDCLIGFSHRFKAPFISMTSSVMLPWGNDRVGNSDHPAYTSNFFLPYTHHMTIGQRIINTVFTEILKLGHYMFAELPWDKLSKKYYGQDIPPLSELKKRTSLILVNSHFSLTNPRPTVPGVVEVGGLHIQHGGKLPEDLKNFLDKATEGVIYFSLGSLIMGETLPEDKFEIFTAVFSQLPQRSCGRQTEMSVCRTSEPLGGYHNSKY